ncbi:MAG: hypothetical protein AAGN35_17155 [Bacteroidota bacterium]
MILPSAEKPLNLAAIPSEMSNLIFVGSLVAAGGLLVFLLTRRFPAIANFFRESVYYFRQLLSGERREARLHKVVCAHFGVGKGIYDPIYRTVDGISYIEGTCSHCGSHVRARLR